MPRSNWDYGCSVAKFLDPVKEILSGYCMRATVNEKIEVVVDKTA